MSIEILWWWMWSKIISKGRRVVICHLQKPDLFHCPNFLHNSELIYFYLFVWSISLKKKTIITFAFLASFTSVLMTTLERLSRSNVRHKLDLLLTLVVIFFCIRYVNRHWNSFSYNTDNNTVIVAVCPTATLTQDRRSTSLAVTSAPLSIKTLAASVPPFSAAKKRGVRQSLSRGSTKVP